MARRKVDSWFVMTPAIRSEMTRMRKAGHPSFVKAHREKRGRQVDTAVMVLGALAAVGLVIHLATREKASGGS